MENWWPMGCYMAVTQEFCGRPCVFIKIELKSFQTVHKIMISPAPILPYYFVLDLTHTLVYLSGFTDISDRTLTVFQSMLIWMCQERKFETIICFYLFNINLLLQTEVFHFPCSIYFISVYQRNKELMTYISNCFIII